MDLFNTVISAIFNLLFAPFKEAPVWGMVVVSIVTGIVMLYVYKITSDQARIKRAKNLVKAHFLAIRLYRDDLSLMLDTMKNILASNGYYIKQSIRPMLFLILPVGLILIQVGTRYEYRPLKPGETTLVTVRLNGYGSFDRLRQVELLLPEGVVMEAPPVRIEQLQEVTWRVRAEATGEHDLRVRVGEQTVRKGLLVLNAVTPVSVEIASDSFLTTLLNPSEASLSDASPVRSVGIGYPKRDFEFLGANLHWLIPFLVLSILAGFAFKRLMGVEF